MNKQLKNESAKHLSFLSEISLPSYPPTLLSSFKRSAFTLAETLIVLAVIGVVAAITMPTLIANYQKKQTVAKLKGTYSILNQALQMSQAENGDLSNWDFSLTGLDFYNRYLVKYLIQAKNYNKVVKPDDYVDYVLSGQKHQNSFAFNTGSAKVLLVNGVYMTVSTSGNTKMITFDINAFKKPNTIGKDIFYFEISSSKGLMPYGIVSTEYKLPENYTRETLLSASYANGCNKKKWGSWCTALIMLDGWEIKKDYPW